MVKLLRIFSSNLHILKICAGAKGECHRIDRFVNKYLYLDKILKKLSIFLAKSDYFDEILRFSQ